MSFTVNWDTTEARRYPQLTVLVTDIQGSSEILKDVHEKKIQRFMLEFGDQTSGALHELVPREKQEWSINNFLGDGFLIFFSEPDPACPDRVGPERAVMAAFKLVAVFRKFCSSQDPTMTQKGFEKMQLKVGIGHGPVVYAPFTTTRPYPTGITSEVTLAFRLCAEADGKQVFISKSVNEELPPGRFKTEPRQGNFKGIGNLEYYEVLG